MSLQPEITYGLTITKGNAFIESTRNRIVILTFSFSSGPSSENNLPRGLPSPSSESPSRSTLDMVLTYTRALIW